MCVDETGEKNVMQLSKNNVASLGMLKLDEEHSFNGFAILIHYIWSSIYTIFGEVFAIRAENARTTQISPWVL